MIIYKITNKQNDKVYIGQTIRSLQSRFDRHINDAMNGVLDTHFARAIRKYGKDSFVAEIIDTAQSQDELNKKEQYWIRFYDSLHKGYNETDATNKCGGNTYQSKTDKERSIIGAKIAQSKIGYKNPQAVKVKCKDINTGCEHHFGSVIEMRNFFGEHTHRFITTRCNGDVKSLYKNKWLIAYEDCEYPNIYFKTGCTPKPRIKIQITDMVTGNTSIFPSINKLINTIPSISKWNVNQIINGKAPQMERYYIEAI